MKRIIALTATVLMCSAASASGLTLVAIPGPGGTTPFKSPGGFGATFAVSPPSDPHRLFVGTQDGYIYVIKDGVLQPTPFLDIHTQVSTGNENGLFSIAFAPDYATSRRFYISYSDTSNPSFLQLQDVHVDAFQTQAGSPDLADASTQRQILFVGDSACEEESSPHYGGQLQFGPDGHLWVSIGDGGDGCSGAQSKQALHLDNVHGKILRFDPEPTQAAPDADGNRLSVPTDDPLYTPAGPHTAVQAIWAYGLRNPYRFSFDSVTHDLWIGDVGNDMQEEIDHVATTPVPTAPVFFGWPCMEGSMVFFYGGCDTASATAENGGTPLPTPVAPVVTFVHDGSCAAVIGGLVLHDATLGGDYGGRYLYGYFCGTGVNGRLLTLDPSSPGTSRDEGLSVGMFRLSSIGTDACGHPYATNVGAGGLNRIQGTITQTCGHPHAVITSAPSGITAATGASIAFVAGEPATFTCKLDSGSAAACASPKAYAGLSDGPHAVAVTATNPFGDVDASPETASWIVDTGPPNTTIATGPPALDNSASATLTFSSSEAASTFTCRLDSGSTTACTSPKVYSGVSDGPHTVTVTAVDAAANADPTPATRSWTVDTAAPQTTIGTAPSGTVATASASITFTSSEAGSSFTCSLDGATPTSCTSPKAYASLSDGSHTVSVVATDAVGNPDATPATATWTVDTAAPQTTISSAPSGTVATTSASIAFTSSEAGSTFTCSLDGASPTTCTSPKAYSGLAEGPHSVSIVATDGAGNADVTAATAAWTIDTATPQTTIDSAPSGTVATASASITFSSSEAGSTFTCSLDGATPTSCTSPKAYSSLADGLHTISVVATDAVGNADPTPATRSWTVDRTAPQTTIGSAPSGTVATANASISFSSSEAGSTFTCSLDGAAPASCTSPKAYSSLSDGSHTVSVVATDAVGNPDATPATATWTVDTAPPQTTIGSAPSGTVATASASISFSSSEPGSTFTCSLDGAAPASCTSPKAYSSLSDGSHTVSVVATDAVGNPDATPATATWTVDTAPPQTAISSAPSGTVATSSASISFTSSQAGSTFTCALDGAAATSCASPKTYSGLADGMHTVSVIAKDPAGNPDPSPATATWIVDTGPPQTTIDSGPTGADAHTSAAFTFSASEGGSTFTCKLDADPAVPCTSAQTYTALAQGPHTLVITATDLAGNADPSPASRTWTVDTVPPDTTITSGPSGTVTQSEAAFTFTASEGGTTFRCSLDGAPAQPCTSPAGYSALAEGSHTLSVTATDLATNADPTPALAQWTVDLPEPPPTTTATSTATTTVPPTTTTSTATTTVAKPPPPRAIHISFGKLKSLTIDKRGRIRLTLSALPQSARGVLTLRAGPRALAPALRFTMKVGKGLTLTLSFSATTRRSIARRHGQKARITLSLVGTDRKTVTASATIRVLATPG